MVRRPETSAGVSSGILGNAQGSTAEGFPVRSRQVVESPDLSASEMFGSGEVVWGLRIYRQAPFLPFWRCLRGADLSAGVLRCLPVRASSI